MQELSSYLQVSAMDDSRSGGIILFGQTERSAAVKLEIDEQVQRPGKRPLSRRCK